MAPRINPRFLDPISLALFRQVEAARAQSFARYYQDSVNRYIHERQVEAGYRRNVTINTRLTQSALQDLTVGASLSMTDVLRQFANDANEDVSIVFGDTARVWSQLLKTARPRMRRAWEEVAKEAIRATVDKYDVEHAKGRGDLRRNSHVIDRFRKSPSSKRYSGGVLRQALQSPLLYEVGTDGIAGPIFEVLDRAARQWYRLNFGAGAKGASSRQRDPDTRRYQGGFKTYYPKFIAASDIEKDVRVVSSKIGLSLTRYGPARPSKADILPSGYWFVSGTTSPVSPEAGRGDNFLPLGDIKASPELSRTVLGIITRDRQSRYGTAARRQRGPRRTAGVAAWGFLNAGVNYIAQTAPSVTAAIVLQSFDAPPGQGVTDRLAISPNRVRAIESNMKATQAKFLAAAGNVGVSRASLLGRIR